MSYPQGDPNQPYDPNQPLPQQPQPVYYPQPMYPYQVYQPPPDHPKATMALVLGIIGIAACGVVAPFAWVIGKRAVREIDEAGGAMGGRSQANAGYIMGIVGSILLILGVLVAVVYIVFIIALIGLSSSS